MSAEAVLARAPGMLVMVATQIVLDRGADADWRRTWVGIAEEIIAVLSPLARAELAGLIGDIRALDRAADDVARIGATDAQGRYTWAASAQLRAREALRLGVTQMLRGRLVEGLDAMERAGLRAMPDRVA